MRSNMKLWVRNQSVLVDWAKTVQMWEPGMANTLCIPRALQMFGANT